MDFKKGDKLKCITTSSSSSNLVLNRTYTASCDSYWAYGEHYVKIVDFPTNSYYTNRFEKFEKVEESIFENAFKNVKEVIYKNRTIIYVVVAICIVDHLFLKGKFRIKLQEIFGKLIAKLANRGAT